MTSRASGGLNDRGQSTVIELFGAYDWAPPPGKPSPGHFILQPGASVAFTAVHNKFASRIADVRYWYRAADLGIGDAALR